MGRGTGRAGVHLIRFVDGGAGLWHGEGVFSPGESPFHVRGTTYLGIRDYAKAHVQGGMDAVVRALPEGPHRAFAGQMFVGTGWYDALPLRPLTEMVAKLEGRSWEDSVRTRAAEVARRDLNVFRRVLFLALRPEKVVERLQLAALQYFDFGKTEIVEADKGHSKVIFHEVPQPLGPWFLPMMQGYAGVLIEAAGGKQPQIGGRLIPKGNREGMGLVDVHVDMRWG